MDDRRVVEVFGEIDIATIGSLQRCLQDCTAGFEGLLEVDLSGVRFMDSTGVWLLGGTAVEAEQAPWSLSIVPGQAARRVLALSGMLERVPIAAPVAAAD